MSPPDSPGPSMREAMQAMHRMLRGEASPEQTAATLDAPADRLATYQSFVRHHVDGVLEKNYTVLPALVGHERWRRLADAFFREVPCDDFELNANVAGFPDWLAARIEAGTEPELGEFHVELCQLEWLEFAVFADEEEIPAPASLSAPTLNPTLQVLELRYPVAEFLAQWRHGERRPDGPPDEEPEVVFVFREPATGNHRFTRASDPLLFAFKVVHDELDVGEAAQAAGVDPATVIDLLGAAAAEGLVLLPPGFLDHGACACSVTDSKSQG